MLIEQTTMPSASILPPMLSGLAEINAVPVGRDPSFRADSSRLIVVARRLAEESRARRERAAAEEAKRAEQRGLLRREVVATRARLAQLEAEANRRQIEFEQGRLSALEAQLQQVEQGGDGPAERPAAVETDTPPAAVSSDTVAAERVTRSTTPASIANPNDSAPPSDQERSTSIGSDRPSRTRATETAFGVLIAAAFLVNVAALSVSRTVNDVRYDELDSGWVSDVAAWLLTLAIAVPLVLYRWFAARWSVAAGVVISVVVFGVFAESAAVRYGPDFNESGWFLAKLVAVGCMLVALWITRHARFPVRRLVPSRVIFGVAIVFSAMVALATIDDWVEAGNLVNNGSLPYRTPVIVWLLFLVAPVTVPVIVLAKRRSLNATMTLATVATTGTVGYTAQAAFIDEFFGRSGSAYIWTAVASAVCAAAAWHLLWRSRSVDGSRSGEH